MLSHPLHHAFTLGIVFFVLITMTNPAWAEDHPQLEQPSNSEGILEEVPAQDAIQDRGIPIPPRLQPRPLAPSAGSGQSSSHPAPPPTTPANVPMPLAQHPQGQQMMAAAVKNASLLDINFTFLNKTYEKDVYGPRNPITGKRIRLSCVRLKVTSGFALRVDVPQFTLNFQGLTVTQNISRISNDGIKIKWQLGPCFENAGGFGFRLSDVKFVYKARPTLTFDEQGFCRLSWNEKPDEFRVSIGDLNIYNTQNDLDKLAKDAVREAVNFTMNDILGSLMRNELTKITVNVCGNKLKVGNK
ncbi:MAG: hypothetical protein OEZ41_04005 [Nitrospirota bacterium]|nr:hypothetical protein [Nitrospirota bacterium]MDH5699107.1 hypothetical protein [Nitrospirota bacterium]